MKTVKISEEEYLRMKGEIESLRNTKLQKKLLAAIEDVRKNGGYTREDLGL